MLTINERICVIDGWTVDVKQKKVVSHKFASSILSAAEKRKLAKVEGLKVYSDIDTSSTVIVNSSSEELFQYIETEDVEFVTMPGRVVTKYSGPHRRAKKSVINEFTLKCHSITLGARNKCYLHFAGQNKDTQLESSMYEIPVKIKTKDNSVFTNIVKVQEFDLTRDDYNILMDLVLKNDSHVKFIAGDMMKILKEEASLDTVGLFGRGIYLGCDKFIKDLLPETLAMFGSRISYLLLVLKCCDELSIFSKCKPTADRVAGITKTCYTATQLADVIAKEVSVLSEDGGDTEFWKTWVFMGAFDFSSWRDFDEGCPCVSMLNYKLLLESLMWMFRFGGVIYGEDKQAVAEKWTLVDASDNTFIGNTKDLHIHVSTEAKISVISVSCHEEQSATAKEKVMSYRAVGDALNDLTETFDITVKELSQWLTFADFNRLHSVTIGVDDNTFDKDHLLLVYCKISKRMPSRT